jgi:hypothetical protein
MFRSALISFALVFGFFVAIVIALLKADRNNYEMQTSKLSVIYHSPFYLLLIIFISIFSAEAVVMFFLSILPPMSRPGEIILDSSLLVMLVSPLLYFFVMRPLVVHSNLRKQAEEKLQKAHDNLEKRVNERTSDLSMANKQLKEKMKQLEEFYEMAISRELKMKKLKEEIEKLKNEPLQYKNNSP